MTIYQEKAAQAAALLRELDLDCWLTFVRETGQHPDPGVELILGTSLTWTSALLLGRGGERIAIVGRYDVENVQLAGVFPQVLGYDEDIRAPLVAALERLAPRSIGLNYSLHDHTADGLSVGMHELLRATLADTPFAERLTSAEGVLGRLRARKTPSELARVAAAVATTEAIVAWLTPQIRVGASEAELAALVHGEFTRLGLPAAWDWDYCPTLNSGPESPLGHVRPSPRSRCSRATWCISTLACARRSTARTCSACGTCDAPASKLPPRSFSGPWQPWWRRSMRAPQPCAPACAAGR